MGLYANDGSINVTVVDGNSYVGAQAADGSLNVLVVDGSDYTGLLAGCGAVNVIATVADSNSYFHPCGAWYVSESPYDIGAVRVTVITGSIGGSSLTAPVLTWDGETLDLRRRRRARRPRDGDKCRRAPRRGARRTVSSRSNSSTGT